MGILNALSTAVTGLSAQSYALDNISGNIANSQTVGFKRVDTSFVDMIPESPSRQEKAGSVIAYSNLTNTVQGTLRSTGIPTNLALNGDGYFVVAGNSGSSTVPVFSGLRNYTRRGDFATDANGYLVNGAGKFLVGTNEGGTGPTPIKIPSTPIPAKSTATISYQSNIPSYPKTANSDPAVPGSELLSAGLAGGTTISANDEPAFLNQSISGGEVTVYDEAGSAVAMNMRWGKTATSTTGGTDTWQLYYQTAPNATGAAAKWEKIGTNFTFTPAGKLTSATTAAIPALTVNGTTIGAVSMNFGTGNLTQYAEGSGEITNNNITQDGYTTGTLQSISVSADGRITGAFSNGQISVLSRIQIAHFNGNDALKRLDGGVYGETVDSGPPSYGLQGSTLTGGSVEMSNTDISEEFSKMIVTQQAYSANTRVLSTAQQMLQDIINVIR